MTRWNSLSVALGAVILSIAAVRATAAEADEVSLKNGDRITGTFLNVSGGTLNMQSAIGKLSVPVDQLSAVSVAETVVVVVRAVPVLRGRLAVSPTGGWEVTDDEGTPGTVALAGDDVILTAGHYEEIVQHSGTWWQDWTGTVSAGYSVQRGNQQTNTFASSLDGRRERPSALIFRPHWRTNAHVTTLLSSATAAGTSIEANTLSASARQDLLVAPGNFVFGILQVEHVGPEGLTLRQTYGGGAGYDAKRTTRATLSVFAGLTFVRETFSTGASQRTGQVLVGEKFRFQLTSRVRLDHTLNAYPNLSFPGRYHSDTNTTIDVKLTNVFSLNTGLIDLYLTNPAAGSRRNSFALTTGIAATF